MHTVRGVRGTSIVCLFSLILSTGLVAAVAPPNPPPDPYPSDNDPYPPTDAVLYYDYDQGGLISTAPDFVLPIGSGTVTLKLVPRDTEHYAVGYFSSFSPGMSIPSPSPLMTAMEQKNRLGAYIWPNWVGDTTPPGYTAGEETAYWNGRRYYYEDLPWERGDKDIDDLWVDIAWRTIGSNGVEIRIVVSCNEAAYLNPLELTFEKKSGEQPIYFRYTIHEPSAGPDSTGSFVLDDSPQTIQIFQSGDRGDWGIFYGTVPTLPVLALPAGFVALLVLKKTRRFL